MIQLKENIKYKTAKICIIGLGYVGLPTAVFFAQKGFNVIGVDIDVKKVDMLNSGTSPLADLGLDEQINTLVRDQKLIATTDTKSAVLDSDIILVIVPTPVTDAKEPDLSCIKNAGEDISKSLRKNHLVVLESTTYPGTTEEVLQPILEKSGLKAGVDFGLAYCPERYNPGDSEHTLENVARVVGAITKEWGIIARDLYQTIIKESVTQVKDIKTAEAAKMIENIQRDLNIALMNELAIIFERMDIDIMGAIEAASTKWNFGKYLPGPGVGGHCLPVDPYFLTKRAQELGFHAQVILAGRKMNDEMPGHVFELIQDGLNEIGKSVEGTRILVLGAAYKANSADLRNSPSKSLVNLLGTNDAKVSIIEPNVEQTEIFGCECLLLEDYGAIDMDCIVLMVNHKEFESIDLLALRDADKSVLFVDASRKMNPQNIIDAGFIYKGVGAGGWN